jgi:hypothetical protein
MYYLNIKNETDELKKFKLFPRIWEKWKEVLHGTITRLW